MFLKTFCRSYYPGVELVPCGTGGDHCGLLTWPLACVAKAGGSQQRITQSMNTFTVHTKNRLQAGQHSHYELARPNLIKPQLYYSALTRSNTWVRFHLLFQPSCWEKS